ncbi:MAG: valine--tRNA ligase [Candidatus Thermoplasmatota archaeon]
MSDYDQKEIEKKWQKKWQKQEIYRYNPESKKEVYSIDVPPRYASGSLHAGHAVHYTHIDFAARYKRMQGYNVFFPLCFDVNGIPIEERVERQMNITRKDIDRHKFTRLCSDFAEKNIEAMKKQFIILGESMDPSIYYQTDAEYYRRLTQISFIELFKKDLIYKGKFPVNWCPRCMTAMADAEVEYKDRKTQINTIKFYFNEKQPEQILKYPGIEKDENGIYVKIATTRPELLPSCQIVAVHPNDERTPWLIDQKLKVPLFEKNIKIVKDEAVDPNFGTGIVMICTIGDKEDLNWVFKYNLPLEMSIDEHGEMTELAGKYSGMNLKEAKKAVIKDLKDKNLLLKQKELDQNVGVCWRCKTPIEFINAEQWFLKTTEFKDKVLQASDEMSWFPEFMKIRLEDWIDSLEWDWVISRQRYFATPIPLWECEKCNEIVLARKEDCYIDPTISSPPIDECPKCGGKLKGCEDVFDTWMDSSISPLYNCFWHRDKKQFEKLYPMSLRPQAHDIIRTWAFYTILRCTLLTDEKPFENMMIGGFILSEDGTPMHSSLGNVIDPLKIIEKYGTDAFRCYAASCSLGEDNAFRQKDVIRGKKILRKLWNVEKFISNALQQKQEITKPDKLNEIDRWILTKYSKLVKRCTEYMENFNYFQCLKEIEYFFWHELADHYIELIKSSLYKKENIENIRYTLYQIGLGILKMFAPFFPHLTEEIYHRNYKDREDTKSIHLSKWPKEILIDEKSEKAGETVKKYVSKVRAIKSKKGIPLNAAFESMSTYSQKGKIQHLRDNSTIIKSTLNLPEKHRFIEGKPSVEEKITEIKPSYSKIGPIFKSDSKKITEWIKNNRDTIRKKLEEKSDLRLEEIPLQITDGKKENLLKDGFIKIKKETQLKGKKDREIIRFEDFFIEVPMKSI